METTTSLVCGLPAISKKLLQRIEADVDFSELPPAKGKGKTAAQSFEGQIVAGSRPHSVSQAVPDLVTWLRCFVGDRSHSSVQAREGGRSNGLHGHDRKDQSEYQWPAWISISG